VSGAPENPSSAAADPVHVADDASTEAARYALQRGPRGALVIAAATTAMLLAGWLAFYFLLFLPRGSIS
jgi:hypothetical protein